MSAIKMRVTMEGADSTLRAFRRLPKEASDELRTESQKLAQSLVDSIQAAARSDRSPQARLFAPTVKAGRDRVPVIKVGGTKRVGRGRNPVWGILFGAEFGSNRFRQFRKSHGGPNGPIFGVVERERARIAKAWNEAADAIVAKFSSGGDG